MWQEIQDNNKWDKLVSTQSRARFLQSWAWGEFQKSLGRKVLRLSWNGEIFAQVIKMNLIGGFVYWYIPHGPSDAVPEAWDDLIKMLGQHGAVFLRVDPAVEIPSSALARRIGGRRGRPARLATRSVAGGGGVALVPSTQPQCTLIMDLSLPLEQLLSGMHQKTRYNINLAEKKGVVIKEGAVDNFLQLNKQTASRDNFVSHHDKYYKKMYEILSMSFWREAKGRPIESSEKGMDVIAPQERGSSMTVWQAEFNGKVLASAMVMYFGNTATYLHGASSNEDRNLMAPYLLHWEIIKDAQKRGFKYYDWWGVNPGNEKHPVYKKSWEGITRFKRGFGGEFISYPPSFDLIYHSVWYRLYKILSRVKRLI